MLRKAIIVFAVFPFLGSATSVNNCKNGNVDQKVNNVLISECEEPPCTLKRGTQVSIEEEVTPSRDIQYLTNSVHARLFEMDLPFIGVDGTDACPQMYNPDGTKAGCPLKKGQQYLYKNLFPVLKIYPKISVIVTYALMEGENGITCFEVPAKIV